MKTIQKYEFTGKRKVVDGVTLRQIRAAMDFYALKPYDPETEDEVESPEGDFEFRLIKKGTLGGWLESYKNLSQEGFAWVADEACVYGEAVVSEGALVCDQAKVYGNAVVQTYARVFDRAEVHGTVGVYGHAMIYEDANVERGAAFDHARIHGKAHLSGGGSISVSDEAEVCDNAKIHSLELHDFAVIDCHSMVCGDAEVWGSEYETTITGHAHVEGTAVIKSGAHIEDSATVEGAAQIIGATVCDYAKVRGETIVHPHSLIGDRAHVELCKDEKGFGFIDFPDGIRRIMGTAKITSLADFLMMGPLEIPYEVYGTKFVTLLFAIDRERHIMLNIFQTAKGTCYHDDDGNTYYLNDEEEMSYLLRRKYGKMPEFIEAVWKAAEYAKAHLSGRLAELASE